MSLYLCILKLYHARPCAHARLCMLFLNIFTSVICSGVHYIALTLRRSLNRTRSCEGGVGGDVSSSRLNLLLTWYKLIFLDAITNFCFKVDLSKNASRQVSDLYSITSSRAGFCSIDCLEFFLAFGLLTWRDFPFSSRIAVKLPADEWKPKRA
jgi:hypothetical protein